MRFLSLIALFAAAPAFAADPERPFDDDMSIASVVFENDLFAGTDRGYTNGIRFAWTSSEEKVPDWTQWAAENLLPLAPDGKKRLSIAFGQSMYAPEDLSQTGPIYTDRPYAGWLYGSLGVVSDTGHTLDNVMLTLGVVGPMALGEPIQKFVHRVVDSPDPKGWRNQLGNEPGIILTYERKWRNFYETDNYGVEFDVMPHVGLNLGNVNTNASGGATFRVGFDLPADYGPPRIRPSLPGSDFFAPTDDLGGYLFATVEERLVVRDIFLDGNMFQDSLDVDKRMFVGSLQVGAALTYDDARLSYTHVFMTKEFNGQRGRPQFGALTLSYRF